MTHEHKESIAKMLEDLVEEARSSADENCKDWRDKSPYMVGYIGAALERIAENVREL